MQAPGTAGSNLASLNGAIEKLKEEQARVNDEKKRLAKEFKNQQRRKRRLKGKARQLSNEDLLAVLLMREERQAAVSSTAASSTDPAPRGASEGDNHPGANTDAA